MSMTETKVSLIKFGGSLITYKKDESMIAQYLEVVDEFLSGTKGIEDLREVITNLMNKELILTIFRKISTYLQSNPDKKIIIVHGAGSIGHSLVVHLLKNYQSIDSVFPIIKLAVSIQNHEIIAIGIQSGLQTIPLSNHQLMLGYPSERVSSPRIDANSLTTLETLIMNTTSIPVFFGDVGFTYSEDMVKTGNWKVFSGDVVPNALSRKLNKISIDKAIYLTNVEGKETGIYTADPEQHDSELISRIEVGVEVIKCYNKNGKAIIFQNTSTTSKFDVTDAMTGKLENILELTRSGTKCWVIGIDALEDSLEGRQVGTFVRPIKNPTLNVVFLGRGDAFSSGGNKSASILIEDLNTSILLDCGPHTLQALNASKRRSIDIDCIIITHFHGDHFGGIPFLLLESKFQHNRTKPLLIIGPPGIQKKVQDLFYSLYENESKKSLPFNINFYEIDPNRPFTKDNIEINAYSMNHTPEAQGYRIQIGSKTIAYTGDTGWTENLFKLTKNVQLAILECNFFEFKFETHLNWHEVGKLYSQAERTVAIHLGAEVIKKLNSLMLNQRVIIPLEGQTIKI
jgi:ribonuclease BN (tRNA processing enzyme)/isopentenyl phosphate kinase